MNGLGLGFLWLGFKVTLAIVPAAAIHLMASRRGPVAAPGSPVAAWAWSSRSRCLRASRRRKEQASPGKRLRRLCPAVSIPSQTLFPARSRPQQRGFTFDRLQSLWRKTGLQLPSVAASSSGWVEAVAILALAGMSLGFVACWPGSGQFRSAADGANELTSPT